jgi:hypothetical protein
VGEERVTTEFEADSCRPLLIDVDQPCPSRVKVIITVTNGIEDNNNI